MMVPVAWYKDTFTGQARWTAPAWTGCSAELRAGSAQPHRGVAAGPAWEEPPEGCASCLRNSRRSKVDLVSLKDGFSLASPAGRLHARILASVAEYETEVGLRGFTPVSRLPEEGKTWGGREKGWRWRVTDEQVAAIREMKAARTPIAKIARITGLSRPTIYRVLGHLTKVTE